MKRFLLFVLLIIGLFFFTSSPASAACTYGAVKCTSGKIYLCEDNIWGFVKNCACANCATATTCWTCCLQTCSCGCVSTTEGGYCKICPTPTTRPQCYNSAPWTCAGTCTIGTCTVTGETTCSCYVAPTAVPTVTPIPTIAPTPIAAGASCNLPITLWGTNKCSNDISYKCTEYPTGWIWDFSQTCYYPCPDPTTKCDIEIGKCCADSSLQYCTTYGPNSRCDPCPDEPNKYYLYCYHNYGLWSDLLTRPLTTSYIDYGCVNTSTCGCTSLTDTCGGGLTNCATLYPDHPDWVSHIDNCNNVDCGPPCGTPGFCTPNCACAASICFGGGTCSNGCGGTCYGTKMCTGTCLNSGSPGRIPVFLLADRESRRIISMCSLNTPTLSASSPA
jgi:hypothetical protein